MLNVASNTMNAEAVLRDDLVFATDQMADHAKLMEMGFVDTAVKGECVRHYAAWNGLRQRIDSLNTAKAHIEAVKMAQDLRAFQADILSRLTNGQWLGWLFPTFIDHIMREGDYFLQRVTHPEGLVNNELPIWLTIEAEHAAFVAHYLDPRDPENIQQALTHIGAFEQLQKASQSLTLEVMVGIMQAGVQLDAYLGALPIGTRSLKTVLPQLLQQHMIKEGRRFQQIAAGIKQQQWG